MERRVAVYVDLENVLPADLDVVMAFAAQHGRPTVRRIYGDWSRPGLQRYAAGIVQHGFDAVQVFHAGRAKNSADIRLAVDVVEDLAAHPDVTDVVLATGDSDFLPVVHCCHRRGRTVHGTGMRGRTSPGLVSACDTFVHYEDLPVLTPRPAGLAVVGSGPAWQARPQLPKVTPQPQPKARSSPQAPPQPKPATQPVRVRRLVSGALAHLGADTSDGWVPHMRIKPHLRVLAPGFDADAGMTFTRFLESMPEVLEWRGTGADRRYRSRP